MFDSSIPPSHQALLSALKANLQELRSVIATVDDSWVGVDLVYRFWHQSLKVYALQTYTERMAKELRRLTPEGGTLHPWFESIVSEGTGHRFELSHNDDWLLRARPIVEAFWHARHMLHLAAECAESLTSPPTILPSEWATLLELYQIR